MDVTDGSVVAMASFPTYDASQFVDGISQTEWTALNDTPDHPLVNRATQGQYAPGSTFKLVSVARDDAVRDPRPNDEDQRQGLGASSADQRPVQATPARRSRSGQARRALTGRATSTSTRPATTSGRRGTTATDGARAAEDGRGVRLRCAHRRRARRSRRDDPRPRVEAGAATRSGRREEKQENGAWYPADDIFTAVGQGGIAVTPLQLANAYAVFANGGTLWKPHIEHRRGTTRATPCSERPTASDSPDRRRRRTCAPRCRRVRRRDRGRRRAPCTLPFPGFPLDTIPVSGKTGTAQVGAQAEGKGDTSLFAAYLPANAPRYVVVAIVEEAGRARRPRHRSCVESSRR